MALCISPVAAGSRDDFEIKIGEFGGIPTYTYHNVNSPNEKYIHIYTKGTHWLNSMVSFKPANVDRIMWVDTNGERDIYLTYSVDDWEIGFHSTFGRKPDFGKTHLKNKGVVNLKKEFGVYLWDGLELELSREQSLSTYYSYYINDKFDTITWDIPDVD